MFMSNKLSIAFRSEILLQYYNDKYLTFIFIFFIKLKKCKNIIFKFQSFKIN